MAQFAAPGSFTIQLRSGRRAGFQALFEGTLVPFAPNLAEQISKRLFGVAYGVLLIQSFS